MKKSVIFLASLVLFISTAIAQNNNNKVERTVQRVDNTINRGKAIVDVFQPYLLKARQLYGQVKQLASEVKTSARNTKNNNGGSSNNYNTGANTTGDNNYNASNNSGGNSNSDPAAGYPSSGGNSSQGTTASNATSGYPSSGGNAVQGGSSAGSGNDPGAQYGVYNNYTPQQYLPINNEASINTDGSGNWGNQNSGLYGNCLDVLTGTVVGVGEAEDNPNSVDLMFFAPSDGQNTYVLMTPSFARNNGTATYMTQHASDAVLKWKDITESEVALTKLTNAQFDRIQNNNQISGAVKNAVNYSGYYTSVGNKLEGMVFAVKVEQENRTVYALVSVVKHFGTSGSNGFLKIKVKSQGIDKTGDGLVDPAAYLR